MEFVKYKISDLATVTAGGDRPSIVSDVKTNETPIPIFSNGVENEGLYGYTDRAKIDGDTVTITGRGVNVGTVCYRDEAFMPIVRLLSLIPKRELVDAKYLYYLLKNITLTGTGSAQPQITIPMISNQDVVICKDLILQKKIAKFLSVYDDKIKINKRINNNLADQVQAIYCNAYDPIMHAPSGILSDICHYSTDKMPVSALSVSTYYSTENMQPNKAGAVDASSLPSISQTTKCHKGDVLVSNIRPYFKKIVYAINDCGCSTDVLCFSPKASNLSAFLFGTLYADRFFDYMVAGSKGTKMPRGDKQQIMNYPIVIPSEESLAAYNETVIPMLKQIDCNRVENKKLTDLQDALLPKLISGEIDVSNIQL